ncbi:UDP-N-acetylenolpyruvoylglucosamine reductase [Cnuibacter physcomitrellae]|uniref:UDP-N-acetylenolpyruvoylglucosamine reductase n=1 Tax=Cnuibacter physcomitrellae TaxID=1619308 RepID=A0A1X9LSV7_9MICO|nr:UDP-N-acetylmuramate dehydrogenase [Cnuibacter physcomitrellae]ARJ06229.1 UDP-N-acetylenolpyruvoylglucosamine reductase [Cnuibacter physcomitrellae]GGI37510.1 UDP-N-acetylenolpyruvoylglucosamine reductase [Cnuibacter physcomitrellae]
MRSADDAPLAPLTTMRVGGPAARLLEPETEQELLDAAREVWDTGLDWFVLGGGSNVVAGDDGFDGTVIRVATTGIAPVMSKVGSVRLRVQAGHSWDDLVRHTVEQGLAGMEALSGIPGSVGASPIQNIGAYGQEVESSIVSLDFLDAATGAVRRMQRDELELSYRSSVFKRGLEGVVLSVTFEVADAGDGLSGPVQYAQLASALGVQVGDRAPLSEVRAAVLALRASKGMVLDASDPDSVSAGSFFTNPIVTERFARTLPGDAPRWQVEPEEPAVVVPLGELVDGMEIPSVDDRSAAPPPAEYHVKLSAAWLIEHAGIRRGFSLPGSRAAVSSKHTLALVNRGGASGDEIGQLARYVQGRVLAEFGVLLQPEPLFVGHSL